MAKAKDPQETAEDKSEELLAEAAALGVTRSKVKMSSFTIRGKTPDPDIMEKEKAKQNKLADKRLKGRVEQKKLDAKKKPIEIRKELLVGRFKAVTSRVRANTYTDAQLKAWTEEYNMIVSNPKSWNKLTKNGTMPFIPGNKKKKTAKEILDGMDLE
jgi:hypothetical protein